jgi:hypothetical protein
LVGPRRGRSGLLRRPHGKVPFEMKRACADKVYEKLIQMVRDGRRGPIRLSPVSRRSAFPPPRNPGT